MRQEKVSKNQIGFGFCRAQIRLDKKDQNSLFVMQLDDPIFKIGDYEILIDYMDVNPKLTCSMKDEICEVKGSPRSISIDFFHRINKFVDKYPEPNSDSMFKSDNMYYKLEGKDGGLFYENELVITFDEILQVFLRGVKSFVFNFEPLT